jgi:hypothetical protein
MGSWRESKIMQLIFGKNFSDSQDDPLPVGKWTAKTAA